MGRDLTREQELAASTLDRAVALTAAAGSGKTTVLVERYLRSLREGMSPREILVVTFTTDAARQLRERIRARAKEENLLASVQEEIENSPYIGTLHAFCYRALDQFGSVLGLETVHSILTSFEWADTFEHRFQSWLGELDETTLRVWLKALNLGDLRQIARTWYKNRAALADPTALEGPAWLPSLASGLAPLFAALDRDLRRAGKYGFDELEELTLEILKTSSATRDAYSLQFRSICVDEFQDTSDRQWEILQLLIGNNPQKLFVVGDPKQSIYRFRGANLKVFQAASQTIDSRGGALLALNDNFRTEPRLLAQVNHVSAHLFHASLVPFSPMRAGRPMSSAGETGFEIVRYAGDKAEAPFEELSLAVSRAQDLINAGARPGSIALLFRVTARIGDYFEAFRSARVPVSARKTTRLFDLYDVLDVYHYLQAVLDPLNPFTLTAFLRSPYVGITELELYQWMQRSPEGLYQALQETHAEKLSWFFELIDSGDLSLVHALEVLFERTGHFPQRAEILLELLTPLRERTDQIEEALRLMRVWHREGIVLSTQTKSGAGDAVRLLTIHGAKGLEFDHVLLVDNLRQAARSYPLLRIQANRPIGFRYRDGAEFVENEAYKMLAEEEKLAEHEESQRLLYVAMTRAKETLTVFLPEDRSLIPKQSWGAVWEENGPAPSPAREGGT